MKLLFVVSQLVCQVVHNAVDMMGTSTSPPPLPVEHIFLHNYLNPSQDSGISSPLMGQQTQEVDVVLYHTIENV